MKKVLFMAAAGLLSMTATAQWEQGNLLVGGASSLSIQTGSSTIDVDGEEADGPKSFDFGLNPTFGYFVADGLAVGLMVDISNSSTTSTTEVGDDEFETQSKAGTLGVGPMVRYYIGDSGLFGQGYVTFGSISSQSDELVLNDDFEFEVEEGEKVSDGFLGWGIGVGYSVMLGDNIALEPMIGFGGITVNSEFESIDENGDDVTIDVKDSTTGLTVKLGITGFLD